MSIFHLKLSKAKELQERNLCQTSFIDQQIKEYLHAQFSDKKYKEYSDSTYVSYYELNCLTLENFRQNLNKRLSNIGTITVKKLISKLSFRRLKLEIYLVLKNQSLRI